MSKYLETKTSFTNPEYIVKALEDDGYKGVIEVYDEPVELYDYYGKLLPAKAEIVIRRGKGQAGRYSNDIGFARQADGTYLALLDDGHGTTDFDHISQRYAYYTAKDALESQGYSFTEVHDETGEIRLQAVLPTGSFF